MIPPVYIAAPFAAATPEARAKNVRRACVLAAYAVRRGLAPVVVHPLVELGIFGRDDAPEERERGLAAACALAEMVGRHAGGCLWVLTRDDGTLSPGTEREDAAWRRGFEATLASYGAERRSVVVRATWAEWDRAIERGEMP